jgi:hypothetical protein
MSYPTISVSLNEERSDKLIKLIRLMRNQDETISRSEVVGTAIDTLYDKLLSPEPVAEPVVEVAS